MGVRSLEKALATVEALGASPGPMTAIELSRAVGLPRPTVYRILGALAGAGYVAREPHRGYRLSFKLLALAHQVLEKTDLLQAARPALWALRDRCRETVHLGVPEGDRMVYLDKLEGSGPFTLSSRLGRSVPIHCTALGKAYLAWLAPAEAQAVLERQPLTKRTARTIVGMAALQRELAAVRRRGYAIDNEEHEPGVRCVGAPILDHRGVAVAAISLSAPAVRMPMARARSWGAPVRDAAMAVSRAMGWRGAPAAGLSIAELGITRT